jgi:hypothetical protein
MPIRQATKQAIINYVTEQGFKIIDSSASEKGQVWTLQGNFEPFEVRLDSLSNHYRKGTDIVCPYAKAAEKIEKFCNASGVTLDTTGGVNLLTCNSCSLTYRYSGSGTPSNLLLQGHHNSLEKIYYGALHEAFPGCLSRYKEDVWDRKVCFKVHLKDFDFLVCFFNFVEPYMCSFDFLCNRCNYIFHIPKKGYKDKTKEVIATLKEELKNVKIR